MIDIQTLLIILIIIAIAIIIIGLSLNRIANLLESESKEIELCKDRVREIDENSEFLDLEKDKLKTKIEKFDRIKIPQTKSIFPRLEEKSQKQNLLCLIEKLTPSEKIAVFSKIVESDPDFKDDLFQADQDFRRDHIIRISDEEVMYR